MVKYRLGEIMINWEDTKTQSIANINDIVDNSGAVYLDGLTDTKKAGVDLKTQCQFNLDNYIMACNNLSIEQDSSVVNKATTYIG